jgi:low temperature requirement protein LtrA
MSHSHPEAGASATPTHRLRRMLGRDPHEHGRVATPLELLFDLVFVVAIGQAASQFAHLLAEGHVAAATGAFVFSMYAVIWAWINYAWFASAFDTDDWLHRLVTMVQMVGVTIMGLGLPAVFHSLDADHGIDNHVVVAGYVVMRVAMLFHWLRAARQAPQYAGACRTYVWTIGIAQVGWVLTALVPLTTAQAAIAAVVLLAIEMGGPYLAETRHGGTPWHAHHIAERYSLLAIIALGEGIVGTMASLAAVVQVQGWTMDAVLVVVAGMGLTFGMWWAYFLMSAGEVLHVRRERSFKWGYGSMVVFAAIAATGAGLDVAGLAIQHKAHIGTVGVVLSLAVPVGVYLVALYGLYRVLYGDWRWFHGLLLALTLAVLAAAPLLAAAGVSMAVCLIVIMLAPAVTVLGYEGWGYRHAAEALRRTLNA